MTDVRLPAPFTHYDFFTGAGGKQVFYATSQLERAVNTIIVMSIGRAESVLKYAHITEHFIQMGWGVVLCEHRGQGFSERLTGHPTLGHVEHFDEYITDLKQLFELTQLNHFANRYLLAHSMGSAIATRYLARYPSDFHRVCLVSPMFGIQVEGLKTWQARLLSRYLSYRDERANTRRFAPSQTTYHPRPFSNNYLTHSQEHYQKWLDCNQNYPQIQLGGVSNHWLAESYHALVKIKKQGALPVSTLMILAGDDHIVDNDAARHFALHQQALGAPVSIMTIADAYHELLQEQKPYRSQALSAIDHFFTTDHSAIDSLKTSAS